MTSKRIIGQGWFFYYSLCNFKLPPSATILFTANVQQMYRPAHILPQLEETVPNNHICSAHVPAQLQATVPNTHIFYITYLIIIFHLVQYLYSIYVTTVDTDTSDRPNAPYFS